MQKTEIFRRGNLGTYIIGGIPSYSTLDNICKDKEEVYIFVDFNSIIRGMYYPQMLEMILNEVKTNDGRFPSILINEWMDLQLYLETYAENRKIKKLHVIYFSEGGKSYYHHNINKNYKKNRKNALFQLPTSLSNRFESYDEMDNVIRSFLVSSWKWIEILSTESNILAIRLENLDADFIPELLLRQFNIYKDESVYIIFSSDGDMIQTLDIADNIYICDGNTIIDNSNWLNSKSYLLPLTTKKQNKREEHTDEPIILNENTIPDITPDKIILFKAIVGDVSDSIPGIKGVGVQTFFKKFIKLIPNDIRADDIESIEKICLEKRNDDKTCDKIVCNINVFKNMIRLVSFKMLIQWLQLNKQRYNQIKSIIDNNYNSLVETCKFKKLREEHKKHKEEMEINNYE